ncbi:histidine phosphatase family protein [Shewanella youngdeokensis]|uniref:Histidine phosphatase family protein n=1 Tax=Shewanella youngdeokensis TaxID=2999068 RepID=A0ABZ0K4A7_9GAMM|nr:histidine phosphatase family protein [Shewanella sp. DAU334]
MSSHLMNYCEFTLLRHGQPEQADCLLGRTNPPLTAKGWQQMQLSSTGLTFDLIISSPLSRCHAYARHLAQQHNSQLIVDSDWQELDFGDWDGQAINSLWEDQHGYGEYWQAPFDHTPPNGETTTALLQRLTSSIGRLSREYAGQRILIVSHSGVMRMLLAWLLNSTQQGNPHLSRVQLEHAAVLQFNTYIDEANTLWPQLQGLSNPSVSLHSQVDN